MNLAQFPKAIATLERQVLAMKKQLETLVNEVKAIEGEVDFKIAQDASLKNDTQRKGLKSQVLQADKNYQKLLQDLNILQGQKDEKEIDLRQKVAEFQVAKIEAQMQIANLNQMSA